MVKKGVAIATLVIILGGILLMYSLLKKQVVTMSDAINAVPVNSALIIQNEDFHQFIEEFRADNHIWKELSNIPVFEAMNRQLNYFDSLFTSNEEADNLIKNKSVIVSTHLIGKDKFEFLYLLNLTNNHDEEQAKLFMTGFLRGKAEVTERAYNKVDIYDVALKHSNRKFTYTFSKGIFIVSYSSQLVEEAIRQTRVENSLLQDYGFKKVQKTAGKNVDANIYINYKTFPKLISLLLDDEHAKKINSVNSFANWTELDVSWKDEELMLYGYTYTSDSTNNYLNVFLNQGGHNIEIAEALPSNTSTFIAYGISDMAKFKKRYRRYLERSGKAKNHRREINKIKTELEVDIEKMFYSIVENEVALVYTDVNTAGIDDGAYIVAKTKSKSFAEEELLKLVINHVAKKGEQFSKYTHDYKVDKETVFAIYNMPVDKVVGKVFGGIFADINTKYFTFVDNYLIFGNSVKSLSKFIHFNVLKKTLDNDANYNDFADNLTSTSNFLYYSNPGSSKGLYADIVNNAMQTVLDSNINTIRKFEGVAYQFSANNGMIYNNFYMRYNPILKEKPHTIWESNLDTVIDFKPKLLVNHSNHEKEIFVQDLKNTIYLINKAGRIQWKMPLDEKITSDIYQLDFYKNGKLQLLFSTKNRLHLIDRLGNYVERYPVKLRAPSTNGVSVFDYENNRDYRLFIACEDKKVYAYDKEGSVLKGWEFGTTESIVHTDVQYANIKNKDYIIFSDSLKTYILDRRGNDRVKVKEQFSRSMNNKFTLDYSAEEEKYRLVTTDILGDVVFIYFDGEVTKISVNNFSKNHHFIYNDINGDGFKEYIFVDEDELEVYKQNKKELFSYEFEEDISQKPAFYIFPDNQRRIGVVSDKTNQIFLFCSNGDIYKNFPLIGKTMFSIGSINKANHKFNLIVGSDESSIYNYQVP